MAATKVVNRQLKTDLDTKVDKVLESSLVADTEITKLAAITGTNTGDQVIPVTGVDFDPVGTDNSDNNAVNTLYSGLQAEVDLNTLKPTLPEINVLQKWISYGESYMSNFRSTMLDLGATYFPNSGGYEMGKIKQSGVTPSLLMIPSAVNTSKLYSVLPTNRVGDFDVVRNCNASYINEDGLIANALPNVPRIDFTDGDGALLTEPQSTNLITYPLSFDNAYWTKSGATVTGGQASPSVDYPTSAFKLVEDTSTGGHNITSTFLQTGINTFSIYIKQNGTRYVSIGNASDGYYVVLDLDLGVIVSTNSNITSSSLTLLSNGFYNFTFTDTLTSSKTFGILLMNDSLSLSYTGDGTSGVYIYGAQVEQLSYPTSLIYNGTEGAQVTRLQDEVTGAGDVNTFNSEEGVLFVEMAALSLSDMSERMINLSNGGTSYIRIQYGGTPGVIYCFLYINGVKLADIRKAELDTTLQNKVAFRWGSSGYSVYINGAFIEADAFAGNFTSYPLTDLSYYSFIGKTKGIKVFKTALTDSQLQELTTL